MRRAEMELYVYMQSHEPIINWLKSEGIKNEKQAMKKLGDFFKKNPMDIEVISPHFSIGPNRELIDNTGKFYEKIYSAFKTKNNGDKNKHNENKSRIYQTGKSCESREQKTS